MKWSLLALSAAALFGQAEPAGVIAIRNATVHPASGPALENATVVVRNGLIEAVGAGVAAPADAWVVEGRGLHVYPGLIDAQSKWGLPAAAETTVARGSAPAAPAAPGAEPQVQYLDDGGPEDRPSNTSWLKAADLVQASERSIGAARSAGFTTAVVFPTTGIFAGQGSAINLAGDRTGEMVVASPVGLRLALSTGGSSGYPGSLMGAFAYIRQVYMDADHYKSAQAMYAQNPRGLQRPAYDRALEGVLQAERVLLPAGTKVEMERLIKFAAELKKPAIFYGGAEAYRAADVLKKAKVPVLVDLKWPERDREADPDLKESLRVLETRENAAAGPGALAKAGVKFAFYSGGVERPGDLRRAVKKAIDAGLDKEEAVRAMTLYPAEMFGFADRLGSIEKGKIGNLTVTEGELFDSGTKVKFVVIDGVKYEPAPEAPATEGAKPVRRGGQK